ncbi:uroporphyrinogen-III C-methyltransferase [Aquitalea sp. FJL05]|uniref:uroporphyrinogen-III C-methyltransferase n=1 Tax=Aquitalea sp. FJL05 TaxID=2153366 RepID=UPI000F5AC7D7|nr:uroporphyrinogen-III C-methyltransferase [Aquitalea sp. FJL05]RQO65742.1 uroporphyrinogen-III C-methyltransferase [Aquitalea sp. FJL05]
MKRATGKVVLLGAGPGDLELLTLKAARQLQAAEVLLLDELVNPDIVSLAPQAQVVRVGKRGGCKSTPQDFIQRLMRRYALQGRQVVRVKGGEVLLFGRAGEEIRYLQQHGIAVEVVNGISSALAAAASLNVSLTHRQHCRGVTLVTAHAQDHSEPDWQALAATGTTLAIYMGMSRIGSLNQALLQHLPATTPVAVVQWASTPQERRLLSTLATLEADAGAAGMGSPAIILVGEAMAESEGFVCPDMNDPVAIHA